MTEIIFPTELHRQATETIKEFFIEQQNIDTILLVNSLARGTATPESDIDIAVLVSPATTNKEVTNLDARWQHFLNSNSTLNLYRNSDKFAQIHLDIIDGNFEPEAWEDGGGIDFFEVEIGNQICYSAPLDNAGSYFLELQNKWLPYYSEDLRLQRYIKAKEACHYDLDHIPFYIARELYFQAFYTLCKAFQKYLQALFIANKTYPLAYNKWIKEQVVTWLKKPDLYPKLSPIISVSNIESNQINDKAEMLRELLSDLNNE